MSDLSEIKKAVGIKIKNEHDPIFINGYPSPCPYNGQSPFRYDIEDDTPPWMAHFKKILNTREARKEFRFISIFDGWQCSVCGEIFPR